MPQSDFLKRRAGVIVLCVAGIAFNTLLFGPSLRVTAEGRNDFMSIYSGTHLAFTDGMYDLAANLGVQRATAGWENLNKLFLRLPFDAVLMWPLGRLPFLPASHVWEGLVVATLIGFCFVWPGDRRAAALACSWSYPAYHVFANGQDVGILLLMVAASLRAMKNRRDTKAGALFTLCAIKFHLFFLTPLPVLRYRRWRFVQGVAMGGAVLAAISFMAGGWNWPAKYLRLVSNPISNPKANEMPSIHGLTAGLAHSGLWEAAGIAAVVALTWLAVRRGGFEYGFAAALMGGILVAPHVYLSDCAMMLPALLLTLPLAGAEWQRQFHLLLFSPLSTIFVLLGPAWVTAVLLLAYMAMVAFGPMADRRAANETA